MLRALLLSLLLSAPSGAAAAARSDDPPVKVWLNQDNFRRGDRARVNAALAEDGYLVVLRSDADGLVRVLFFFSSRRRHTRWTGDWSSDVCSSDLEVPDPFTGRAMRSASVRS